MFGSEDEEHKSEYELVANAHKLHTWSGMGLKSALRIYVAASTPPGRKASLIEHTINDYSGTTGTASGTLSAKSRYYKSGRIKTKASYFYWQCAY